MPLILIISLLAQISLLGPSDRVDLKDIGLRCGFSPLIQTGTKVLLKSGSSTMIFESDSRKLMFNGILIWMNGPLVREGNAWTITQADSATVVEPLLRPAGGPASAGAFVVVIDPGHGGSDIGAIGRRKVYEKKITLDIAKRVRKKLQASDITAKLTRKRDYTLGLQARTDKARKWGADIFVSIHINSARNSNAAGVETYVLPAPGFPSTAGGSVNGDVYPGNKYDSAGMVLVYHVHKEILAHIGSADRGIRRARFDVIRNAPCPAVLVECGFVSNRIEEDRMIQRKYRAAAAEGIARGILEYLRRNI